MKYNKFRKLLVKILERVWPLFLLKIQQVSFHAEPELGLIPFLCEKSKTSIDVGGNRGRYSIEMIKHSGKCWAFEPNPDLANNLRRIFKSKLNVEEVALSNEKGQVNIRIPLDFPGRATIEESNPLTELENIRSISVPQRRLDNYEFDSVNLIKIDVEGHEMAVLEGATKLLSRDKPAIILEADEQHKPNCIKSIRDFLENLGYTGFFFLYGKLENIEEFNLKEYQNLKNMRENTKIGLYINNFIFVDSEKIHRISKFIR